MNRATTWIAAACGLEVLTGAGLVVAPSLLARLLFGSGMNGTGDAVGGISGLVLLCLALAAWPRGPEGERPQALAPLLALSLLATLYLVFVGLSGASGVLLWPAAAVHLVFAILLARALLEARRARG